MHTPSLKWQVIESDDPTPGPRSRHGFVYDRLAKTSVLFGGIRWPSGSLMSDTWEFRGGSWSQIRAAVAPPSRHRCGLVFDSKRGFSVLFGGQTVSFQFWRNLNDTWLYEDHCWKKPSSWFQKRPTPRCGHAMAFDEELGLTVLFGGVDSADAPLGDTWTFDGVDWRVVQGVAPPPRRYAAFAYHPELKGCVLHGGAVDDNGKKKFGDTWLFRGGQWFPLGSEFQTTPRDDHAMAYHHAAGMMVVLESLIRDHQGEPIREVLTLTNSGWKEIDVSPLHPRHQCSPLTYDSELGGLLLYGGELGHGRPQLQEMLILLPSS